MANIYIALVDTPGLFADLIRKVIKQNYIHTVLSLDPDFEEAYSFGRRNPSIPLLSGFEKEDKHKVLKAFPGAKYMIYTVQCTEEQKAYIQDILERTMPYRYHYHYATIGLPYILFKKAYHQKYHYTCSSYLARLLDEAGVIHFGKHFSLVTPRDFLEYGQDAVWFEGKLAQFIEEMPGRKLSGRSSITVLDQAASGDNIIPVKTSCQDSLLQENAS
ncbi:MAG: hypothetical protein ACOYB8_01370 [Eubacteriaceae bacterium]|jgi:hypothetical protein